MFKAESISTLSDCEDDIDNLEGSMIWSQEEPLSSNEILELSAQDERENSLFAFCRLCAGQTTNPIYIYSESGESMKLAHKINTCLSVKIKKTDPLPKQLCLTCVEKVNWCDTFDTQCIKAEEILSTMLEEKQSFNLSDQFSSNQQSCPLCIKGFMNTCEETLQNTKDKELYENDIILESSDEENIFNNAKVSKESGNHSIILQCLGTKQKYLKCGACMNLYHTEETLDGHKCKPSVQNTTKPYKCLVCDKTFTFEERLNFHMQFHKGTKALYCEICKMTFGKELKLFYHYKRQHSKEISVSCLQCGKLFENQETLRVHVCVDGKNRPHICEVCNKGFFDGYTLKRHIVTHLPEKPYKCSECSKSFTQKSRLNKHVTSHCIVIENNQTVWKCIQCGEAFISCDDADIHYKIIHEDKITLIEELSISKLYHCEFCNSHFINADNLKAHQKHHVVERPYKCNMCMATYKSFAEAVLHWKEHPRLFKVLVVFLCDVCNKDTKELSLLYKHKQNRHNRESRLSETGDAKFICELCGSVFDEYEDIKNHGRDQCSKFPCDICGSLLPTANSLNAHKRRHNGLRPYVCNICGKSYTQSSHMWTHKRFHMGIKPYACEYCDQRFTIKPDLADHVRKKHTRERPFKCDVCNKAFLTGSVFYQHRLIHRGDRRYKCHYCEKAFTRTEALNNHIKIHTGEKPHSCDICGRCFRQKGDMRKHRRTKHASEQDKS
ncbi:PREDICTED: zinc finger protein 678 [Trachymyrmex cornetzi]|uniref:Zinc finger protein 91 n=1 Tax=Trachymyrmex cornetzi TaxID=471704 RepID=A0A195DMI1_9HYME|nr:PREDICTED: zinc finger protein 678 [Trachymyrmex cornetzi]KYN14041.1 Zinc finger protein 91 [Trachymyrmex cornetzi]